MATWSAGSCWVGSALRAELAANDRADVVLNVRAEENRLELLDQFAEAGADLAMFVIDSAPESATLRTLDDLAATLNR